MEKEEKYIGLAGHVEHPDFKKWETVSQLSRNNSLDLVTEMDKALENIKDFLKTLTFYDKLNRLLKKGVLRAVESGDTLSKTLSEHLLLGRTILNRTKHLLFLEKESDWPGKSFTSLNKKSPAISETESLSSMISNTTCYARELEKLIDQFDHILSSENTQSKNMTKFGANKKLQKAFGDTVDFVDVLAAHLATSKYQLKFSILPTNTSEHVCAYKLLHLSVQGNGKNQIKAKKNAAMNLVQLLIDLQHRNALPESVMPFSSEELNALTVQFCQTKNYIVELKNMCNDKLMKPPTFLILQSKPSFTVQCSALGQIALGSNESKSIAKRLAAKRTIELFKKCSGVV